MHAIVAEPPHAAHLELRSGLVREALDAAGRSGVTVVGLVSEEKPP